MCFFLISGCARSLLGTWKPSRVTRPAQEPSLIKIANGARVSIITSRYPSILTIFWSEKKRFMLKFVFNQRIYNTAKLFKSFTVVKYQINFYSCKIYLVCSIMNIWTFMNFYDFSKFLL